MPSNWAIVESNFPTITGNEPIREQIRQMLNYMSALTEQMKYNLSNLDTTNWNSVAMTNFQKDTTRNVEDSVEDLDDDLGDTNDSLELVKKAVEDISQTLLELQSTVDDISKWKEESTTVIDNLGTDMDALKKVVIPDGKGGVTIGTVGQELRLVGKIYINDVLVEQQGGTT